MKGEMREACNVEKSTCRSPSSLHGESDQPSGTAGSRASLFTSWHNPVQRRETAFSWHSPYPNDDTGLCWNIVTCVRLDGRIELLSSFRGDLHVILQAKKFAHPASRSGLSTQQVVTVPQTNQSLHLYCVAQSTMLRKSTFKSHAQRCRSERCTAAPVDLLQQTGKLFSPEGNDARIATLGKPCERAAVRVQFTCKYKSINFLFRLFK